MYSDIAWREKKICTNKVHKKILLKKNKIFLWWRPSGLQGRVRDHAQVRVPGDFLLKRVRVCAKDWLVLYYPALYPERNAWSAAPPTAPLQPNW